MNIQLTEVLSDIMGMTGQTIIRAMVAGERDPQVLARHRHNRVKASAEEVTKALTGNWREEHLFVLRQALAMYDDIARHLTECDAKLQALLAERSQRQVDLGKAPKARQQAAPGVRCAPGAGELGGRRSHPHQRPWGDRGDEAAVRNRTGLEPLRQRQALLFMAGPVPRHQDQRRQGAVGQTPSARPTGCDRR